MALANPTLVLCFSGANTSAPTSTAWKSPSPNCVDNRSASSRLKSGDARTSFSRARALVTASRYDPAADPEKRGSDRVLRGAGVEEGGPVRASGGAVADDELLDHLPRGLVGELHRRRLHEVRRRPDEGAGDAAVHGELRAADRVDHDAGRVRRVPHLELQLHVERHVPKRLAL